MRIYGIMSFAAMMLAALAGTAADKAAADRLAESKEMQTVTLVCQWHPQAQFAGFYMALEKGFYRRYGLDVNIRHADTTTSNTEMLLQNKAQFITTFLATAIRLNERKIKVVNVGQIFRRSSLMVVARKADGIRTARDLDGRSIGVWYSDFEDIPRQFLAQNNLKTRVVMINSGVNMFLFGGVDALTVTSYNELHSLIMAGISLEELTIFRMGEHSLDIPEDGIYCRKDYFEQNKQLCRDFARASVDGWKYAAQHPEETLDVVERMLREYHLPLARVHQKWMLTEVLRLAFPAGVNGLDSSLSRDGYYRAVELLHGSGKIDEETRYDDFYKGGNP